jgi:hypothetical protein
MRSFSVQEGKDFPGEFGLAPTADYAMKPCEQAYVDALKRAMDLMKRDVAADPDGNDDASTALRQARTGRRTRALNVLKAQASQFLAGLDAKIAADNVFTNRGRYLADLDRQTESLFLVEPAIDGGQVCDVLIRVADELPITSDPAAQAKRGLYVALGSARTVVKTVARRMEERAERPWRTRAARDRDRSRARALRDEYMKKLVDIGRLGLQDPHVELGNLALNGFRTEFVAQEAGRIKNSYLRSLGISAGIVAAVFFGLYIWVENTVNTYGFWYTHRIFLLAAGGAGIGTWLSFSIRRVTLGFDDLGVLEEDRLDPSLRVVFVVILTVVVCLLFWTGTMNLEIGNLKTGDLSNPKSALPLDAIALLVGIFCGIAERALATAVSGRATAFVKSVGT